MPDKMEATYVLKYDCKHSKRYYTKEDTDFPIKDVYVLKPWCDKVEKFTLTIEAE